MWKRICPSCSKTIEYSKRDSYNKAVRLNRICSSCANKKNRKEYSQQHATGAIVKKRMENAKSEFNVGKVIGGRTVISDEIKSGVDLGKTKKEWYVQVRCECGKEEWVRIHALRQRKADLCANCRSKGERSPTFIGYKDMPGKVMSRIKNSASARTHTKDTIDFDAEYVYNLFHSQNGKCKITGISLDWGTASLDRINSSVGYTKDNVQWVHQTVNKMKLNMSDTEFISWCKLITENNP
jgi:hypothetical protein